MLLSCQRVTRAAWSQEHVAGPCKRRSQLSIWVRDAFVEPLSVPQWGAPVSSGVQRMAFNCTMWGRLMHEVSQCLEALSAAVPSKSHWRVTHVVFYVSERVCWGSHLQEQQWRCLFCATALHHEHNFMEWERLLLAGGVAQPVSRLLCGAGCSSVAGEGVGGYRSTPSIHRWEQIHGDAQAAESSTASCTRVRPAGNGNSNKAGAQRGNFCFFSCCSPPKEIAGWKALRFLRPHSRSCLASVAFFPCCVCSCWMFSWVSRLKTSLVLKWKGEMHLHRKTLQFIMKISNYF